MLNDDPTFQLLSVDQLGQLQSTFDDTEVQADWAAVGKAIWKWMNGEAPTLPDGTPLGMSGSIDDLKLALSTRSRALKLPPQFTKYQVIDNPGGDTMIIRMPPKDLTNVGHDRACGPNRIPDGEDNYAEPAFYVRRVRHRAMPDHCEFFFCRIADYTMSMCR